MSGGPKQMDRKTRLTLARHITERALAQIDLYEAQEIPF